MYRNVLQDVSATGLRYYASTNYDHRSAGGEVSVFDTTQVKPYVDSNNIPGLDHLIKHIEKQ